jgi:non-canonical purine NTP pyrophosphatase (RdgB/HAM1 family)
MNPQQLLKSVNFVTGNPNKVKEAEAILGIDLNQVDMDGLYELQTTDFDALVRNKAQQAYDNLQKPVLVEDSGLLFSAWNGLPGALVKWFESSVACTGMLKMLEGFDDRKATAVCYVALQQGPDDVLVAVGQVTGSIAETIRGEHGFGWDVIFIPDGHDRTFAEMSAEEKNCISHRKKAFLELKSLLASGQRP